MNTFLSWLFLGLYPTAPKLFAQQPLNPQEFAYGMLLELPPEGALYEVILPAAVYEGVTRADLSDLCVFNGQNEVVPYLVQALPATIDSTKETTVLPFFPLYGKVDHHLEGLALKVKRGADGTIVDVQTNEPSTKSPRLMAYLLDASKMERPITALKLDFEPTPENFILPISIDRSNDLETWYPLVKNANVVDLKYGGHSVQQKNIDVPPTKTKYLRLSWPAAEEGVNLTQVNAELVAEAVEPPRQWLSLNATVEDPGSGEYYFTSSGYMPVDRIRVKLPQKNTVIRARFLSRANPDEDWQLQRNELIYYLQVEDEEINNPDLVVNQVPHRYWLMRVDQSGGGLGGGLPQIELGWVPQQLLFAARGEPPFTLAYGNVRLKPARRPADALLDALSQKKNTLAIKTATAGPQFMLGGESRLKPPVLGSDWKHWLLWTVLIAGVFVLLWMAVRLYRQMNVENVGKTS